MCTKMRVKVEILLSSFVHREFLIWNIPMVQPFLDRFMPLKCAGYLRCKCEKNEGNHLVENFKTITNYLKFLTIDNENQLR